MSENTENGAVAVEEAEERKPTERVILEHTFVIKLPGGGVERDVMQEVIKLLGLKRNGKPMRPDDVLGEAWVEVSRQIESSKTNAIELYAGKSGTADAKVGIWRAPSVTAWKGAVVHEAPPAPLVERRVIE